jgi:probable blue pigment (indigoidine) exporter
MIAVHEYGDKDALDSCVPVAHAGEMNRLMLVLLTALAPIAWGTTYLVTTELLPPGHPLFAGLLRALPAGLLAVLISRRLPHGSWWWKSFVLGALNIGAFFPLLFLAAERLPGGVAAAVAGAQPLIVLALGALVLQEKIRPLTAAAAVIGAGGVALVVLGPAAELDFWGVLAAIGGVTATGAGMILTKRWGRPDRVGPVAYAGWQLSAGGLLLLPLTLAVEGVPAAIDGGAALGYLWLGTAGGIVAYTLWFRGVQQLPVIAPGLLALLSPIVATTLGVLVAGERFTGLQAIGLALTIGALVLGQIVARPSAADARRSRKTSSAAALAAPR